MLLQLGSWRHRPTRLTEFQTIYELNLKSSLHLPYDDSTGQTASGHRAGPRSVKEILKRQIKLIKQHGSDSSSEGAGVWNEKGRNLELLEPGINADAIGKPETAVNRNHQVYLSNVPVCQYWACLNHLRRIHLDSLLLSGATEINAQVSNHHLIIGEIGPSQMKSSNVWAIRNTWCPDNSDVYNVGWRSFPQLEWRRLLVHFS